MNFDLMPIRQEDRERVADAIERCLSCEIVNCQLDEWAALSAREEKTV
jgi:hypothetical protein